MDRAVYPGTFDPVTYGHLDIIERGRKVFAELIVAVLKNPNKSPLFSIEERLQMLRDLTADMPNVRVDSFDGMAVEYVRRQGTNIILRGIRTVSDFEYELQMALTNRTLAQDIETVFVMSNERYYFMSSRLVKEAVHLGANVDAFVPPAVQEQLRQKLA